MTTHSLPLGVDFFQKSTVEVAQALLGKVFCFGSHEVIITETEAYGGLGDPASHAAKGPTPRAGIMFGPPARLYVYLIYGMYHCLNVVTEQNGVPGAVLIRGAQLRTHLRENLNSVDLNGPGKLCRFLSINLSHNGLDLTTSTAVCFKDIGIVSPPFQATPRIGIKKGVDKLWRFIVTDRFS